ncbi:MAG: hypothetical protein Q9213_001813 [Squamulea squamosa]
MAHFLELPGEIRNQVYRYVFQADDDYKTVPEHTIEPLSTVSTVPDLALLFVNRQTHREFFPYVYIAHLYVIAKLEPSYANYVRQMGMTRTKRHIAAIAKCPHFAMRIDTTKRTERKCGEEFYLVFSSQDLNMFISLLWLFNVGQPRIGAAGDLDVTIDTSLSRTVEATSRSRLSSKLLRPFANVGPVDSAIVIDIIFKSSFEVLVPLQIFVYFMCLIIYHKMRMTIGLTRILRGRKNAQADIRWKNLVYYTEKKYRRLWPILWRMKTLPCTDFEPKWLERLTSYLYLVRVYTISEAIWNDRYSDRSTSAISTFMRDWDNREPDDPHRDLSNHLYTHLLWVKTIADVRAHQWEAVTEDIQQALKIGHPSLLCELNKQWKLKEVCKSGVPSYGSNDWRRWQDIGIDLVDTFTLENIDRVLEFPNPQLQLQLEEWIRQHIRDLSTDYSRWDDQSNRRAIEHASKFSLDRIAAWHSACIGPSNATIWSTRLSGCVKTIYIFQQL